MEPNFELILTEVHFRTSRSGGKGGQNVNKTETKTELVWSIEDSQFLDAEQKELLKEKLAAILSGDAVLSIRSQKERSQLANKELCILKFKILLQKAFKPEKKRKATKIPKSVKEKRLTDKKILTEKKERRKKDF